MAVKTITIDVEAYRRLKKAKKPNESFSQAIKRIVPERISMDDWLKSLEGHSFSEKYVDAVEHQVRQRRAPQNMRPRRGVL